MWSYEVLKFHDLYGIWGGPNRQVAQVTGKYVNVYKVTSVNNFAAEKKMLIFKIYHFIKNVKVFLYRHKCIVSKMFKERKIIVFKHNVTVTESLLNVTLYKIYFNFFTAISQLSSVILQLIYIDNSFF